jgi:hypothetical protein
VTPRDFNLSSTGTWRSAHNGARSHRHIASPDALYAGSPRPGLTGRASSPPAARGQRKCLFWPVLRGFCMKSNSDPTRVLTRCDHCTLAPIAHGSGHLGSTSLRSWHDHHHLHHAATAPHHAEFASAPHAQGVSRERAVHLAVKCTCLAYRITFLRSAALQRCLHTAEPKGEQWRFQRHRPSPATAPRTPN